MVKEVTGGLAVDINVTASDSGVWLQTYEDWIAIRQKYSDCGTRKV
jgi:hypothetical protein